MPSSRLALLTILIAALGAAGCRDAGARPHRLSRSTPSVTVPPPDPKRWPDALPAEVELVAPELTRRLIIYLDAGHGAQGNPGNTGSYCIEEQEFTRELAVDVIGYLEETGYFVVVPSRTGAKPVSYADRVTDAARAKADVFISLHSDIRGTNRDEWSPSAGLSCKRSFDAPGFSVLFADEGEKPLVGQRLALATNIAKAMIESGFIPYTGAEYRDLYEGRPAEDGVFVDRHAAAKRIFVLRKTTIPAVIVETHNALDPREALAWQDPTVRRAFAMALGRAVLDLAGANRYSNTP